jgi:hypothetical protein
MADGQIVITGGKKFGSTNVTVTTEDRGHTATVVTNVISATRFIMRIDSVSRPIFYARMDEVFTVDYGDGVDSTDYRFVADEYSPNMYRLARLPLAMITLSL